MTMLVAVFLLIAGLAALIPLVGFVLVVIFTILGRIGLGVESGWDLWQEHKADQRAFHPEPNILPPLPPPPPDKRRQRTRPAPIVEVPLTSEQRARKLAAMRREWEAKGYHTGLVNQETGEVYDPR